MVVVSSFPSNVRWETTYVKPVSTRKTFMQNLNSLFRLGRSCTNLGANPGVPSDHGVLGVATSTQLSETGDLRWRFLG